MTRNHAALLSERSERPRLSALRDLKGWHCHAASGLRSRWRFCSQGDEENQHRGYRFPPEIIQQAIWLYLRFTLSLRDVEDLLAERGIMVSYETVRRWVNHSSWPLAFDAGGKALKRTATMAKAAMAAQGIPRF